MKRSLAVLFGVLFCTGLFVSNADAQNRAAANAHIAKAKALAWEPGHDLIDVYEGLCEDAIDEKGPQIPGLQVAPPLSQRRVPARNEWYSAPAKVFDNLYWIGSQNDSAWAVMTSEGIILIDTGYDYSIKELSDGLKKLGSDPSQIKYVVLSHAHGDRYFGAKFLQDTYKSRIMMSEADWAVMAKSNEPNELKAKKDMVITDGQKLTLGDMTVTLYLTPGHTPGTVSTLIPGLKDGNQRHVGIVWGGMAPSYERYGVRYYSSLPETFKTWGDSLKRFHGIAKNAGADVYLAIHPHYDRTIDKIRSVQYRKPGAPHPYVSKSNVDRFMTIMTECVDAKLARVAS